MSEFIEPGASPFGIDYAKTDKAVQPLYLLADSQLLFVKEEGTPVLASLRQRIAKSSPVAAYVGASNGDDPAYYSIFEAAMEELGFPERHMVHADPGPDELDALDHADLILLAGGDVERGWQSFQKSGLKQILVRRYYEGALFVGISAGAVQLGLAGWGSGGPENAGPANGNPTSGQLIDTFRIIPHLIGAHEENEDWAALKAATLAMGDHVRGFGIPFGGGLIYHPDHTVEPLRKPVVEIRVRGQSVRQGLLLPGEAGDAVTNADTGTRGTVRRMTPEESWEVS